MDSVRQQGRRVVEFGIYRDGDNNLDASQAVTLRQALRSSAADGKVEYTVQDTTSRGTGELRTDEFRLADGDISGAHVEPPHDMSDPANLAGFVARVLDNAEKSGAAQTWIELTDHGGGDGGGLQTHDGSIMSMPDIAAAIARGVALHAQTHPDDASRKIDGVVANQCLMATLGFADALSKAGVRWLAASPETMVSPGVPTDVADAIAAHPDDARAMGRAVVGDVMRQKYGAGGISWGPAAAFDVLDLDAKKMQAVETSVKALNDRIVAGARDPQAVAALRDDGDATRGMVRFPQAPANLPWHADRPAIALYGTIASDGRLDAATREAARVAEKAVDDLVVAHEESRAFEPFGGQNYSNAVGPTTHFPTSRNQVDPWAPKISETNNQFFKVTDAAAAERTIA